MTQTNINIINKDDNSIINNNIINNNKEKSEENTNIQPPKEKELINTEENNQITSVINQSNNNTEMNNRENSIIQNIQKDRSINELGQLILKFRLSKSSNYDAVDLFKDIFDKDASLGIDKKELQKGCEKMGIILTNNEFSNILSDFEQFPITRNKIYVSILDKIVSIFNLKQFSYHLQNRDLGEEKVKYVLVDNSIYKLPERQKVVNLDKEVYNFSQLDNFQINTLINKYPSIFKKYILLMN